MAFVQFGAVDETRTRTRGSLSRDFKQKTLFLDYLITFNFIWSGSGRSCLLLRRFTSQVVSTRSLNLSKASLALRVPFTSAEFNHLFDMHFYIKGTHLYQFSLVSAIPPQRQIKDMRQGFHLHCFRKSLSGARVHYLSAVAAFAYHHFHHSYMVAVVRFERRLLGMNQVSYLCSTTAILGSLPSCLGLSPLGGEFSKLESLHTIIGKVLLWII